MNKRKVTVLVVIIVAIIVILIIKKLESNELTGRGMDIETYITNNISDISPEKEVLGGKFYITNIETLDGAGIAEYEDGHNAYVADFTYSIEGTNGAITITSFTIRK